MAEIVNLRQVRKTASRREKTAKAAENAARFGLTKAQKRLAAAEADIARQRLDGHRREEKDQ